VPCHTDCVDGTGTSECVPILAAHQLCRSVNDVRSTNRSPFLSKRLSRAVISQLPGGR